DCVAEIAGQLLRPVRTIHTASQPQRGVGEISGAFGIRGHRDSTQRALPDDDAVPLIVAKEKELVVLDGAADRASELVFFVIVAGGGEVVLGVEVCVSQKLKDAAMKSV